MEGSAVLVTGAASGIGRASALAFLAAGARVAALDVDAARLAELPGEMMHLQADVRRPAEVEGAIASVVSEFGRLDVAHNNAGVPGPYQPLWEYSEEDFARVLEVDLVGVWRCLKHEARQMIAQGSGCIVNTSSMLAEAGMAQNGVDRRRGGVGGLGSGVVHDRIHPGRRRRLPGPVADT